jgi:hypothetical protein
MDKKEKELKEKLRSALIEFAEDWHGLRMGNRITYTKKNGNEIIRNSNTAN